MHAAYHPRVPACHSSAVKEGQPRAASQHVRWAPTLLAVTQAHLGLMLLGMLYGKHTDKACKGMVMLRIMNIGYSRGKT